SIWFCPPLNQIFFILPNYAGRYEAAEAGSGEGGAAAAGIVCRNILWYSCKIEKTGVPAERSRGEQAGA
ncbi:hypothetical protein, partial [Flavonifractor plautii]|uniref:hypothetical protein n=1 Tax=Flavonifractor plautii TaxID=292800 RepID=UPI00325A90C5